MEDVKNFTFTRLRQRLMSLGCPGFCAEQVLTWIYCKRIEDFGMMSNLSKDSREIILDKFYCSSPKQVKKQESADGTKKFLFELSDNSSIETAFIPYKDRNTVCLSTQVGCRFACGFCASGKGGFIRNLSPSEMVNQYLYVCDAVKPQKISNIVFMGIGEPLDNFESTLTAVDLFCHPKGIAMGKRRVTISTCGLPEKIKNLADQGLGVKLSVSLHSAFNDKRTRLMPVNKRFSLEDLKKSLIYYCDRQNYPVSIEYVLIDKINTGKEDAAALCRYLRGIKAKVNIMVYNGNIRRFKPPDKKTIDVFSDFLNQKKVFFTLRKPRGSDIDAACGQLKACAKKDKL